MAKVNINDKEYDTDNMSDEAKKQLGSLQFVQGEINKLNAQIAVCRTAAVAYTAALKKEIDGNENG